MYRNIDYKLAKNEGGELKGYVTLWTWDEHGNPIEEVHEHKSHLLYEDTSGDQKSMFGTPLKRINFNSAVQRANWKRNNPDYRTFDEFRPEQEFLLQHFSGKNEDMDFIKYDLRKQFIDIEVAVGDEFPEAKDAKYPVNVLTLFDSKLNNYHCWVYENMAWLNNWELNTNDPYGSKIWSGERVKFLIFKNNEEIIKNTIVWKTNNIHRDIPIKMVYDKDDNNYKMFICDDTLNDFDNVIKSDDRFGCITWKTLPIEIKLFKNVNELDKALKSYSNVKHIDVEMRYNKDKKEYCIWLTEYDKWVTCGSTVWEVKAGEKFGDITWDDTPVVFHVFQSEKEMAKDFLKWQTQNYADAWSGWNIESFDVPYIINRFSKLTTGAQMSSISPVNKYRASVRQQRTKSGLVEINSYKIAGLSILDLYTLYANKFGPQSKQSYKLEATAQDELGYGKMEFDGTIKEFYIREFFKFVKYNIIDVKLCVDLNKKLKYIELARKICNFGLCEYEGIYSSSPYIMGGLSLEAKNTFNENILNDDRVDREGVATAYVGGFVCEPKVGYYKKGLASGDFNSLYPSIIIALNISNETKIGRIEWISEKEIKVCIPSKNFERIMDFTEFKTKFNGKVILSSNDILYLNPNIRIGILPSFLSRLYKLRKSTKKEMLSIEKNIAEVLQPKYNDMVSSPEKMELGKQIKVLKEKARLLDATQYAYKIYLNSIYGQMGNKYFPLFDIDNAASVTKSGQRILQDTLAFIDDMFKKRPDWTEESVSTIYGDTDSVYFNAEFLVRDALGHDPITWDEETVAKSVTHIDNVFIPLVNANCVKLAREVFMSPLNNIEIKRETFCDYGIFVAKKRYVLHVRNDEGVMKSKFKSVGVDIKKNEYPTIVKKYLERIIYTSMLEQWDNKRFKEEIDKIWQEYKNLPPDSLGFIKGYRKERESDAFLSMATGTTIGAKVATFYNQMIDHLKLKSKYEEIRLNDTLRFSYIKPSNPYGLAVIGWKDTFPKEFDGMFEIDYSLMFEKNILKPLERFIEIYRWEHYHPLDKCYMDIDDI